MRVDASSAAETDQTPQESLAHSLASCTVYYISAVSSLYADALRVQGFSSEFVVGNALAGYTERDSTKWPWLLSLRSLKRNDG